MEAAPAMASSSSSETEETTGPLVGAVPAPDANDDLRAELAAFRRSFLELSEIITSLELITPRPPPERWFQRLWRLFLARVLPSSIRIRPNQPPEDFEKIETGGFPGAREELAMNRQIMQDCLNNYNRLHPGNEYEPVLGNVLSRNPHLHNGVCWTHGNFIAQKKRFGPLSFLFAPRAVFFYELAYMDRSKEVVTCTPVEEPAYYTALGFPLWWATLRSGKLDTFCKTCHCRFGIPRPGIHKINACGHNNMVEVCEMCSHCSDTWHPDPGEFAFGYHHPYHPYPTRHRDTTNQHVDGKLAY